MISRAWIPIAALEGAWTLARTPRLAPVTMRQGRYGRVIGAEAGSGSGDLAVVGLGDSIVVGIGVDRYEDALPVQFARELHRALERPVAWELVGRAGATSRTVRHELASCVPRADIHLLSLGVNDAVRKVPPEEFSANLAAIVGALRERSPASTVIHCGIPPLHLFPALPWPLSELLGDRARCLAHAARQTARQLESFVFYEFPAEAAPGGFARDGFHPNAAACSGWAHGLLELYRAQPAREVLG